MYPGSFVDTTPDKAAVIMAGSGEQVTYAQLEERSARLAQFFHAKGLRRGDVIAVFMENNLRFYEVYWAAMRSGLYFTAINRYLQPGESSYIVNDSGARALFTSAAMAQMAEPLSDLCPNLEIRLAVDGPVPGFDSYEDTVADYPAERLASQPKGETMLYSSGTTGRPKGVKRLMSDRQVDDELQSIGMLLMFFFAATEDSIYLSPAPLYHAAPLGFSTGIQAIGGTVVVMDRFDATDSLRYIEEYQVTHSQWVPTMFSRIVKLPEDLQSRWDLSSHQVAIHAAAPCSVELKNAMFEQWGPIIHEYYAGSEGNGFCLAGPDDWLAHPGTVGKPILGSVHICDDDGNELPNGETGTVYFGQDEVTFEYHNDPTKTDEARHPDTITWSTLGDVGHLDDDGFLYLTDRKSFMIISGGVNIYPQEIEDCLLMHPKVADVAVIGVPNEDLGEEVKAVVQLEAGLEQAEEVKSELLAYAGEHLARYKVPRSLDFNNELPRLPTGKLYKRLLRDEYWAQNTANQPPKK